MLIQKVEFIACCFTFCGWVLIRKVEEFIALVVLLPVGVCWSERVRSSLLWLFYFLWVCVDPKG